MVKGITMRMIKYDYLNHVLCQICEKLLCMANDIPSSDHLCVDCYELIPDQVDEDIKADNIERLRGLNQI